MRIILLLCKGALTLLWAIVSVACTAGANGKAIDRYEAEQIALHELKGGFVAGGEQELDLGRVVFKILVQNGQEARRIMVDAATGRVIETRDRTEELREETKEGESVLHPVSVADRDGAEFVALKSAPGTVRKWRVKRLDGRVIYRFNILVGQSQEMRVTVDGVSHQVLEIQPVNSLD